jgi:hypothetical protein
MGAMGIVVWVLIIGTLALLDFKSKQWWGAAIGCVICAVIGIWLASYKAIAAPPDDRPELWMAAVYSWMVSAVTYLLMRAAGRLVVNLNARKVVLS